MTSGIHGRAAYRGGWHTAALNLLLHYFIAFLIALTCYLVSRNVPLLRNRPIACGLLYGLVVYGVMNFVVLPLSAAGASAKPLPVLANGILIHLVGVGLPSALFAARAR